MCHGPKLWVQALASSNKKNESVGNQIVKRDGYLNILLFNAELN